MRCVFYWKISSHRKRPGSKHPLHHRRPENQTGCCHIWTSIARLNFRPKWQSSSSYVSNNFLLFYFCFAFLSVFIKLKKKTNSNKSIRDDIQKIIMNTQWKRNHEQGGASRTQTMSLDCVASKWNHNLLKWLIIFEIKQSNALFVSWKSIISKIFFLRMIAFIPWNNWSIKTIFIIDDNLYLN